MATARRALRQRREQLGWTQEGIALALGVSTKVWLSYEAGDSLPRPGRRPKIARLLKVSLAEVHRMFDSDGNGELVGHSVPLWLSHLASLEHNASEVWAYQQTAVHGLLHTPEYTEFVERDDINVRTPEAVAERVQLRLRRQAVLRREPNPLKLTVVLDEAVLHRVAGDRDVMAHQLDHLVDLAALPNVAIRVIPLAAGAFSAAFGAFTLLAKEGSPKPYMAVIEDRLGAHYLDRDAEVVAHLDLFEDLAERALPPAETVDLIRHTNKERYL